MKNTGRIWAVALIIQPIIFAFIIPDYWPVIIPIEIIGSIPGILTFGLALHAISVLRISIKLKWALVFSGATILAYFCSWAVSTIIGNGSIFNDAQLCLPAAIAAILGVLINAKSVHKQLKNEEETIKDPASSIFNV